MSQSKTANGDFGELKFSRRNNEGKDDFGFVVDASRVWDLVGLHSCWVSAFRLDAFEVSGT